jgi:hypothetical protein
MVGGLKMIEKHDYGVWALHKLNGENHRPNGPAVEWFEENTWDWYLFGECHRYYGPQDHTGGWWLYGGFVK